MTFALIAGGLFAVGVAVWGFGARFVRELARVAAAAHRDVDNETAPALLSQPGARTKRS